MTWGKGQDTILRMLEAGELERVPADEELADRILDLAVGHLATAEQEANWTR